MYVVNIPIIDMVGRFRFIAETNELRGAAQWADIS
jgi:hypothetical protein